MKLCHVVQTHSLREFAVAAALGLRTFVPTLTREVRHARRVEKRVYPLYSRYIFAWFDEGEVGRVLRVGGVVDVLRKAGSDESYCVDERVVEAIRSVTLSPDFCIGEEVVVRGGRWDGLQGLFSASADERVMVMLSMLGKKVEMPFHISQIIRKPVSENADAAI